MHEIFRENLSIVHNDVDLEHLIKVERNILPSWT